MSNNTFDIQRFGKLIKRQWLDPRSFKLRSLAFAAMPLLFLLGSLLNESIEFYLENKTMILLSMMVIIIIFSPFIYFTNINHPKKGVIDAMLPASTLEKFLVMQLTGLIYAPLFILITYGGADALLTLFFPKVMGGYAVVELVKSWNFNWEKLLILFGAFQSMVFCNLWFKKNKLLKTAGAYALFVGAIMIIALIFVRVFIENTGYTDMRNINFSINGDGRSLMIQAGDHPALIMIQLLRILIDIVMPIALTIGSYFMLKSNKY